MTTGLVINYTAPQQDFLPMFTGNVEHSPANLGRAPNVPMLSGKAAAQAVGTLVGSSAYAVEVYPGYNLVSFTADKPSYWTLVAPEPGNQYFAGDFIDGDFSTLYVIDHGTTSLYAVDSMTGATTLIGPSTPYGGESWTGMTGSTDGTMYASSTNISRSTLYTVDLDNGATTGVGQITSAPCILDIAITSEGDMYGVDICSDVLVKINPATGAGTVIGSIGFDANFAQGMDYDDETGTLYLAGFNNGSFRGELRIADPATGNSMLVGAFPGGAEVDSLPFATGGGSDIIWLSENPNEGIVLAGTVASVAVTFDSTGLTEGDYFGTLRVRPGDANNPPVVVPVTLHVVNSIKSFLPLVTK